MHIAHPYTMLLKHNLRAHMKASVCKWNWKLKTVQSTTWITHWVSFAICNWHPLSNRSELHCITLHCAQLNMNFDKCPQQIENWRPNIAHTDKSITATVSKVLTQNHCNLHLVNVPYNCKEKCALQLILHKFSMFRLETCNWSASAAFPGRKNQEEGCSSNLIIWSRNFLEKMRNFLKSDLNWIEEFPRRKTKHWELFSCAGPSSNLCNMTSANLLWGLHVLALRSSFGKVQESLESLKECLGISKNLWFGTLASLLIAGYIMSKRCQISNRKISSVFN